MDTDADVELVLSCYRAFARGDIAAAVAPMADDVTWVEPPEFANGGAHHGREAVRRYLQASYDSWSELRSTPSASRQGERVLVVHHLEGLLSDGSPQQATVADVFQVVDRVIVSMQAYADPDEARRILGVASPSPHIDREATT